MYAKIILSMSISIQIIGCLFLQAEASYMKPKLERNNVVNKGVWVRNKLKDSELFEKSNLGNFIFRPNSIDADNALQNNFDVFGETTLQDPLFVSNYIHRNRRSPEHMHKRRPRKSMKMPKAIKTSIEDSVMIKSKIVSNLKPSVLNEYPYEVAILLNNNPKRVQNITFFKENHVEKKHNVSIFESKSANKTHAFNMEEELKVVTTNPNAVISTDVPKRSKKYYHNTDGVNSYNMVEEYNTTDTDTANSIGQGIFSKDERIWIQNSPLPDSKIYKVVPKKPETIKRISEKGFIKVISMLTKTFKKITKQHTEIKNIYQKLTNLNQDFDHKEADIISKFEDFDSKYSDMIQFNDKIKGLETRLDSQKEYFEIKQKEIQNTFLEFQNQQKKFLAQQRQFYTIQKLMLAQNEKINAKQNLIAKTQSEISHRQYNFVRILKKAKQIINDTETREIYSQTNENNKYKDNYENKVAPTTSPTTANTQGMKINLFSIPTKNKLENQDALIIKEKDDKQIDDLVYKFYFNNTFIDSLMKSKILNNYESNTNSIEIVSRSNQAKNKRNELETTFMLPVNNSLSETLVKRERRWINHFNKNKFKRLNRHRKEKSNITNSRKSNKIQDDIKHKNTGIKEDQTSNQVRHSENSPKNYPFMRMATNFCNEIGQNTNEQVLKWCKEKTLRRLKFMELNSFTPPPTPPAPAMMEKTQIMQEVTNPPETNKKREEVVTLRPLPSRIRQDLEPASTLEPLLAPLVVLSAPATAQTIFFPDNDALESNLKQYEFTPDTEGNVYYEGSVHISDYGRMLSKPDSGEGTSDIMPGLLDSNSKVDMDPLAFELQAKRRAYVRRINEDILEQHKRGH